MKAEVTGRQPTKVHIALDPDHAARLSFRQIDPGDALNRPLGRALIDAGVDPSQHASWHGFDRYYASPAAEPEVTVDTEPGEVTLTMTYDGAGRLMLFLRDAAPWGRTPGGAAAMDAYYALQDAGIPTSDGDDA